MVKKVIFSTEVEARKVLDEINKRQGTNVKVKKAPTKPKKKSWWED